QELSKRINQDELIHSLFIAIDQNYFDCLELLLSKKEILKSTREEDNVALYRTLLQEAVKRKNMKMFELLIKKNPLDCLNKPGRYPLKDQSDLRTVLDSCSCQATPSYYSPANEQ